MNRCPNCGGYMVSNYCGACDRERRQNSRNLEKIAESAVRPTQPYPPDSRVISAEAFAVLKSYLADEMVRLMEVRDFDAITRLLKVIEPVCPELFAAISSCTDKIAARQAGTPAESRLGDVPRWLVLVDVPEPAKVEAVKAIRIAVDGLGLKEGVDFVMGRGPAGLWIPAEKQDELADKLNHSLIHFRLDPAT